MGRSTAHFPLGCTVLHSQHGLCEVTGRQDCSLVVKVIDPDRPDLDRLRLANPTDLTRARVLDCEPSEGLRIVHRKFGPGVILQMFGGAADVDFGKGGTKRILFSPSFVFLLDDAANSWTMRRTNQAVSPPDLCNPPAI